MYETQATNKHFMSMSLMVIVCLFRSPETALLSWNGLSSPCDYKPVPGLLKASSLTLSTSGLISCQENYANETWCSETFAQVTT